ncbi:MAG TPA: hypothetical protein VMH38_01465 [Thermoplasmata archaeon]|nr:hypothetical protein [Thermoplasmata archaeon]
MDSLERVRGGVVMQRSSKNRIPVLGSVLVAGFMVFVLTSSAVGATPAPAASGTNSTWSYGAVETFKVPLQRASDTWTYQGNATYGYTVTIFENATGSTTLELTVLRTMGVAYSIQFCQPTCSAAKQWSNQSARIYESTATFANFTDQGAVYENGTSVAALALENSTTFVHDNLTESADAFLPSLLQQGPHLHYLAANLSAESSVAFAPALGLFPTELNPGTQWNSSSDFSALGSASWDFYYSVHTPATGTQTYGPISGNASLTTSGSVSVQGAYAAGNNFRYDGTTYPAITLSVTGPFDVREGVVFVPSAIDVFGSASQPWGENQTGSASAQMATLDLKPMAGDHLQLVASSWHYSSIAANSADSMSVGSGVPGVSAAVSGANPVSSGTLQGEPETAAQASGNQQCLTTGGGCPAAPGGLSPRAWFGLFVVSGVVAVAAVLVVLAVVSRRRRAPAPVYPNAVLYPPGAAYPSAPSGAPVQPAAPPAPEEDPLDHLW